MAGDRLWIEVLDEDGTSIVKRDYARVIEVFPDGSVTLMWEPDVARAAELDGFMD